MTNAEKVALLRYKTGLSLLECKNLLCETDWDVDTALNTVDIFVNSIASGTLASKTITESIKNAGLYNKLSSNLSTYNTMRGGAKGFKGFVFEELHATDATIKGQFTEVISNNGIADFKILNADSTTTFAQAKVGYKNTSIDWSLYDGQTIIIDNGNKELIKSAKDAGKIVIESGISEQEAKSIAKAMQYESKITGNTTSKIVPKMHSASKIAQQCHTSGVNAAKNGAAFGAGFSIGSNIVEVINGEKELPEAAKDIAKDTVVAAATGYAVGAAATAAGTAIAGTAVGGAAIAAGAAAVAAAPVVLAGAAIGGVFTIGKKIFGR